VSLSSRTGGRSLRARAATAAIVIAGLGSVVFYAAISATINGLPSTQPFQGWVALLQPWGSPSGDQVKLVAVARAPGAPGQHPAMSYTVVVCGGRPFQGVLLMGRRCSPRGPARMARPGDEQHTGAGQCRGYFRSHGLRPAVRQRDQPRIRPGRPHRDDQPLSVRIGVCAPAGAATSIPRYGAGRDRTGCRAGPAGVEPGVVEWAADESGVATGRHAPRRDLQRSR
jgi:hypothetical protein